jgi:parallel beta-helix repeat protein
LRPGAVSSRWVVPAAGGLWGLFLGDGLVSGWASWDSSLDFTSMGYYASRVLGSPALPSLLLVLASLVSALAILTASRRLLARSPSLKAILVCFVLLSVALVGNAGLWVFAAPGPNADNSVSCSYDIFPSGNVPAVWSRQSHATTLGSSGDLGAFATGLVKSNQTLCFEPGHYSLATTIHVADQHNVTLFFSPGATMTSTTQIRLLQIIRSSGVEVLGGRWVGPGAGAFADIEIDRGSSSITVKGTDVSGAGHDGIIIRNVTTPDSRISILDNYLHENVRYGVQAFENKTASSLGILISGNRAEDNRAGGIYTNGAGGLKVIGNTVKNTVGTRPGLIGIGVTNGGNDTVTGNKVDHMFWYGIQVFYNNNTVVANNYASFNAGASDQSGITNDHSFHDKLVNNTVVSNGLAGIHVERSSYVTIQGNNASRNGRFGIEFYHGDMASTSYANVTGNVCSRNDQAGIIMNSGVDSVITGNHCLDNSGPGVLLYNDQGQVGSSGNIIANNWLGDDRGSPSARTQTFGVRTVGQADNNTIVANSLFNNTVANISAVGTTNIVRGNVESPVPVTGGLTRIFAGSPTTFPL